MRVPVMHVGIVRVRVYQRRVNVRMSVWLAPVPSKVVRMPMVFIMRVGVRVLLLLVRVQMPVALGEVQPNARGHQQPRGNELQRNRIALKQDRQYGTEEWTYREVSSRACGSEMAERNYKQDQAHTIADESDRHGETDHTNGRECLAYQQRQGEINGTCNKPFQAGDQGRVTRGYLACQVVVDCPEQTGKRNESQSPPSNALLTRGPHQ